MPAGPRRSGSETTSQSKATPSRRRLTTSPGFTALAGFTRVPLRCTRPPCTASAAMLRDL